MDSKFSGAVQLTDLNDFITPSQECIKPVQIKKSSEKKGLSKIQISTDGNYMEVDNKSGKTTKLQKAEITLNDCLACSGCITSAESVLVAMQSHEEFLKVLNENNAASTTNRKVVVISVSPQARASLAVRHEMSIKNASLALHRYFKRLGADIILDTTYARELVLIQSAKEFLDRFKNKAGNPNSLPMLTSSCPGWICYAEKTHGKLIIPHLSFTKSPQQVTGTLVKDTAAKLYNKTPDKCYHVAIMPCYDKKLEASRSDFIDPTYEAREVDLVLTASEIQLMLEEEGLALQDVLNTEAPPADQFSHISALQPACLDNDTLLNHAGGGSGGYLEYVFKNSAKILFDKEVETITYKRVRNNKDFRETVLTGDDGKVLLSFAAAYGFRSIQNLVQKIKKGKCPYHFVEVMACPSGCLNGGGQIRSLTNDREDQKKLLSEVERLYDEVPHSLPEANLNTIDFLASLESDPELKKKYLHTQYHAVEKDESLSAMAKW